MTAIFTKLQSIFWDNGLKALLRSAVDYLYREGIRGRIPRVTIPYDYNGVKVPLPTPILDTVVPPFKHGAWTQNRPDHEDVEVSQVREHCSEGDSVVIVGGGFGVTAVIAAEQVGAEGKVVVYEVTKELYNIIEDVVRQNGVADIVTPYHTRVGKVAKLEYFNGTTDNASILAASHLPDADVYEIDCEGGEIDILKNMEARPGTVIVETHAVYDAPKIDVAEILEEKGYAIVSDIPNGESLRVVGSHVLVAKYRRET